VEGWAVAHIELSAHGADWSQSGREAAVVRLYLDGEYHSDIVTHMGDTPHDYPVSLGPLDDGEHTLRLEVDPERSAVPAVRLGRVAARVHPPSDPMHDILACAPIIHTRPAAEFSDIPLLLAFETGDPDTVTYTVYYSNEDGGTPPAGLMARWGRLTDIEWILSGRVAGGRLVDATYQAAGHATRDYRGDPAGPPELWVSTVNGMASDEPTDADGVTYRIALPPVARLPHAATRERLMDRHPFTWQVMADEWAREGQEVPTDPATTDVGSPLDYLYVDYRADVVAGALDSVSWSVRLAGTETRYRSDHGLPMLRPGFGRWLRVAIELPPGTRPEHLANLRCRIHGADGAARIELGPVFMLTEDYRPGPHLAPPRSVRHRGITDGETGQWIIALGTPFPR
jgi:hypothetical protein